MNTTPPLTLRALRSAIAHEDETATLHGNPFLVDAPRITDATLDSREVTPGCVFIARPGLHQDGFDYVEQAIQAGAVAVVSQRPLEHDPRFPHLVVRDVHAVVGPIAAAVHGYPSQAMDVLGVTGTNGKTTTTYMLEAMFRAAGKVTGVLGTIQTRIGDTVLTSARTTPEATDLQRTLAHMRDQGVEVVIMEVSSHGVALGRVHSTSFKTVGFTNLTQDHLDYHEDMESYFAAKQALFTREYTPMGCAVIGDVWAERLVAQSPIPITTLYLEPSSSTLAVVSARSDKVSAREQIAASNIAATFTDTNKTAASPISPTSAAKVPVTQQSGYVASDIQLSPTGSTFMLRDTRGAFPMDADQGVPSHANVLLRQARVLDAQRASRAAGDADASGDAADDAARDAGVAGDVADDAARDAGAARDTIGSREARMPLAPSDVIPAPGLSKAGLRDTRMPAFEPPPLVHIPMPGLYNVANALLAIAMASQTGLSHKLAITGLNGMAGVPGRMECVSPPGHPYTVVVDYAHTPDAITNVLRNVDHPEVVLTCVVGCGGDRDTSKRPLMADASLAQAEYSIFTSDNPRGEDPEAILDAMTSHLPKDNRWERITDRREAIREAIHRASEGHVIVIAGKGHETYQEDAAGRHHFDDREEARAAIASHPSISAARALCDTPDDQDGQPGGEAGA